MTPSLFTLFFLFDEVAGNLPVVLAPLSFHGFGSLLKPRVLLCTCHFIVPDEIARLAGWVSFCFLAFYRALRALTRDVAPRIRQSALGGWFPLIGRHLTPLGKRRQLFRLFLLLRSSVGFRASRHDWRFLYRRCLRRHPTGKASQCSIQLLCRHIWFAVWSEDLYM